MATVWLSLSIVLTNCECSLHLLYTTEFTLHAVGMNVYMIICYTWSSYSISVRVTFKKISDQVCLCGLVFRVSGYRYRGPGFDPRRYQIF